MKNISFTSVENFYEEARVGIDFEYNGIWYQIDFDDPKTGKGKMQISKYDEENSTYYDSLYDLVHNYKIGDRTLAEIICDENGISRSVLPVKNNSKTTCELFEECNGERKNG